MVNLQTFIKMAGSRIKLSAQPWALKENSFWSLKHQMWCDAQIYNPNAYKNEAGGDNESKAKLGFIMRKKNVLYTRLDLI